MLRQVECFAYSTLSETSTTQNQCNSSNKYSPVLKLSDGKIVRKTTAIWLFQEGEHVSSDRLFQVRAKQPFSSETRTSISGKPPVNETPYFCDEVDVGEMCAFSNEGHYQIGRILQFCHYEKKKVSEYQYQSRFVNTKQRDLGVLWTWFEEIAHFR